MLNVSVTFHRCTERQVKDFRETSAKLQLSQEPPTIYIDLRNNKFQTKQSAISHSVKSPVNMEKEMSSTKRTTKTKAKRQKR